MERELPSDGLHSLLLQSISSLKKSSVQTWKKKYTLEIAKKRNAGEDMTVKELVDKKRGRLFLLGCELDQQVRAYPTALRNNVAVVNTAIAIACAGVVKNFNSNLLECNQIDEILGWVSSVTYGDL